MGEVLSDNIAAVEELLAVGKEQELGFPALRINGKSFDAVVEDMAADEVFANGGTAEAGGFTATLRARDFKQGKPRKGDSIEARGMSLEILSVKRSVASVQVTAGDPVNDE